MREGSSTSTAIAIVDPHEIARVGLRRSLEGLGGEVVADVADPAELNGHLEGADVLVFDIDTVGLPVQRPASLRCIALTDMVVTLDLRAPGRMRVLSKRRPAADLATRVMEPIPDGGVPSEATVTDRRVLSAVAVGKSNAQIADDLGTTIGTVQSRLRRLYRATGAESRHELALAAALWVPGSSRWSPNRGPTTPTGSTSLREQ